MNVESIIGETLTYVDIDDSNEQILLTTKSGKQIRIYHSQDCCESVHIEDTHGSWHDLLGKVIIDATHEEDRENDPPKNEESWTRTTLTFKVNDATVINKWIGTSNGYYSESVNFEEIVPR